MKNLLPQNDPDATCRKNALVANQASYRFNHHFVAPIPILDRVPHKELFNAEYTAGRLKSLSGLLPNMLAAKARHFIDRLDSLEEYEDLFPILTPWAQVRVCSRLSAK